MLSLRPVVVTVLLGLSMTMTQAPAQAAIVDVPAPTATPLPMAGELFTLHGELSDDPDPARPNVYLQRLDGGKWSTVTQVTPDAAEPRKYSFNWRISTPTSFRVTAYQADNDIMVSATRYVRIAAQYVAASIERICNTAHDCGNTAKVVGQVSPPRGPRLAVLQYRSGSSWKSLSVKKNTDATGKFEMDPFSIAGWSQWSAKVFRVAVGRYNGSGYAVSAPITFMPGPTHLGDNVLRVDVSGGSFPSKKGVDYTGHATVTRLGQTSVNRARLDKFGVRGSTTAGYPKKPYNLRFASDPGNGNEIFGMKADKRWTLLAMYADQSYVRDKTALDLGRKLTSTGHGMSWNPESRYVELFVNSLYMGAYLLAEKVDIDGDKVEVGKTSGMIMEADMDVVSDPRKGFRTARGGMIFAFKEPDSLGGSEGVTPGKLSAIKNKAAAVESYLYTSNRSYYRNHIDRDSAADFYLAQEFIKDTDADFWRSKYFTWDYNNTGTGLRDGKLHFGPLWDFDKSIGNIDATNPATAFIRSYRGWHANGTGIGKPHHTTYHTHWFAQLWKVPSFRSYVAYRWSQMRGEFYKTALDEVDAHKTEIGWGAINDRYRWAGHSKLYKPKGSSYNDEVKYVKYWLINRFKWMDSQL